MYPYCIGYDPWRVSDLEQDYLKRLVGESHVLPVSPTMKSVSPLVREHELDLRAHKVICPNPCLHHNRTSVQVREDPQGNVQVQKKNLQPHQKIDGFMAELYSLAAFNKFKDQYLAAIDWKPPEGTGDEETTDPDQE
jgi:phage terminase large subunit-like protein